MSDKLLMAVSGLLMGIAIGIPVAMILTFMAFFLYDLIISTTGVHRVLIIGASALVVAFAAGGAYVGWKEPDND